MDRQGVDTVVILNVFSCPLCQGSPGVVVSVCFSFHVI
jgi:hypothetical protein